MKAIDLFSGCGGLSLGFQKAGFEIVGFVEKDESAIKTHQKNFPDSKLIGKDITKISDELIKKYENEVDIIIGGPPCQGFSMCGKRNPKDPRNQLYKEYLRFVRIIRPKYLLIENVLGLLTMDFSNERVISIIVNDLIRLGYSVSYRILDSSDFNVAQSRKRLFIIGKKCNLFPISYQTIPKTVLEELLDLPCEENSINGHVHSSLREGTLKKIKKLKQGERIGNFNFGRMRLIANKPSPTVATKDRYIHPIYDRFLTPRELARLQSFPDDFEFVGCKTSMLKQIGNAVPVKLAEAIARRLKKDE